MRVTPQTQFNQAIRNLQRSNTQLLRFQTQVSSGLRLTRPSDDPASAAGIARGRAETIRFDTHLSNIRDASFILESGVGGMLQVRELLTEATQIAIEANSSANVATNEQSVNASFAEGIDGILNSVLNIVNRQLPDGRSLFAGTATDETPFVVDSVDGRGRATSVSYRGASEDGRALVGQGQTVQTFLGGDGVFQNRNRGDTLFFGATGAASGTGADSATGRGTLQVRHTATIFAPGSGVQTGTSSAASDTILGPAGANVLTINDTSGTGASGTVSLGGGPTFSFTNADTDLRVTGPNGAAIFIDTTAINPGFNGNVNITADGTLSVDNGASTVAINFAQTNQVITNSLTGEVTNVDATNVSRTGDERLVYTGTLDVFQSLIALRTDLLDVSLTGLERSDLISTTMSEFEQQISGVLGSVGLLSAQSENLDTLARRTEDVQLELEELTNSLESTDFSEAILGLQSQENLFQIGLAVAARVNSLSLINFLT